MITNVLYAVFQKNCLIKNRIYFIRIKNIVHLLKKNIYYNGDIVFDLEDVFYVARVLEINFDKFSPQDFLEGINIELEHGTVNPNTNVTNNSLITTAKIALSHLNEFPNYYNKEYGLKKFEEFLRRKIK